MGTEISGGYNAEVEAEFYGGVTCPGSSRRFSHRETLH